nr:transposase, MuDR, plant [Tanacetum cinerariifolium]
MKQNILIPLKILMKLEQYANENRSKVESHKKSILREVGKEAYTKIKSDDDIEHEGSNYIEFKVNDESDGFVDNQNILEGVAVYMKPFKDDTDRKEVLVGRCDLIESQADLDVIDLDSFGSDIKDGIDSERRKMLRELRKKGKSIDKNMFDFFVGQRLIQENLLRIGLKSIQCRVRESLRLLRMKMKGEPNLESLTRTFRRIYVCLGALKKGFKASGGDILGLDGCFMKGPYPNQILTAVGGKEGRTRTLIPPIHKTQVGSTRKEGKKGVIEAVKNGKLTQNGKKLHVLNVVICVTTKILVRVKVVRSMEKGKGHMMSKCSIGAGLSQVACPNAVSTQGVGLSQCEGSNQGIRHDQPSMVIEGFENVCLLAKPLINMVPILEFICEALDYFKVYISRFDPFGMEKLMTLFVMCKTYGGEPSIHLLLTFLNLGPAGGCSRDSFFLETTSQRDKLGGTLQHPWLHGEYSMLILEEKKWVNYEQTLAILCSKVEGLDFEREWLKTSKTYLLQEVYGLRQDMATVVTKVIPYMAMQLVYSDEMDLLVACLTKATLFYGRCDDLATSSYAFLTEVTTDPYAPLEVLLSKKPKSLQVKPISSKSKPSSLQAHD